jgi:topoisomerase-4 subunit B
MAFAGGEKTRELEVMDSCGKRNTGTAVHFVPDPAVLRFAEFLHARLAARAARQGGALPGLRVTFLDEKKGEKQEWYYEDGLTDYLLGATEGYASIPAEPFTGAFSGSNEGVDWAVQWLPEGGELVTESYVNLIPTAQGGTHVNGLRTGLLEAMREFCELRSLLPRGVKLTPDDIWERCSYVLSSSSRIRSSPGRPRSV